MTEKPRAADPADAGSAPGGDERDQADGKVAERIVIRDKRRIDATGKVRNEKDEPAEPAADEGAEVPGPAAPAEQQPVDTPAPAADAGDDEQPAEAPAEPEAAGGLGAELESLRSDLEERTRDLQRVSAEYANYRKRVDRDRGLAAEQTTGLVISALLPVLDDLDRAREHGDLVGPFGSVAEQLVTALGKFGLTAFGEKGDPFDPTRHDAVAHLTSGEVTEPTCIDVMRRGYQLGDRLLRPALVAVADPE
ncbi:nucleotide exchange factor GrpE [Asanoa sp. WMMD1127]|uniref:nucleotide exchange factor GrpE n=1 Tax=Asanoa sp. WMMD1127 TaxID=3016107 RepID=UPI0024166890|nr:nucleotide exchange factor GrpE [Asanoa sp. WMMD1127]MDG4822295.1 nucleotide exchange factor GrpE [Asanoa sp. WMMD1127]